MPIDATLKLTNNSLAFGDLGATSNPSKRYFDYSTQRTYQVQNAKSDIFSVDPGATVLLFDGTRSTTVDNTTEFILTLSSLASTRYRMAWDGTGTSPGFRTDRALALNTRTVTMTVNGNATLSMAANVGDFTALAVGDVIFIPGVSSGDTASPFDPLNEGYWAVLSKDGFSSSVQLARFGSFSGISETPTVTADSQVQAFSAAGVQVGDKLDISGGFSASVIGTYQIVAVTANWVEFFSNRPLPIAITATPDTALAIYTSAKRYLRVEGDQNYVIRLNGDTGNTNKMIPWVPGDPDNTASLEKAGAVWSASVVNLSSSPLSLLMLSAE